LADRRFKLRLQVRYGPFRQPRLRRWVGEPGGDRVAGGPRRAGDARSPGGPWLPSPATDVGTTMIYTHVLNRGDRGVLSPADRVL